MDGIQRAVAVATLQYTCILTVSVCYRMISSRVDILLSYPSLSIISILSISIHLALVQSSNYLPPNTRSRLIIEIALEFE